jgi:hypothetical protein
MDEKLPAIEKSLDKVKEATNLYAKGLLDEFTFKHILQDAAIIFTHAAITGKVRNFNHG